ncbi:hypothetical protein R1sor_004475 [Riccia sorocarpa]|uniref:BRCT domain-containing protein n=1 Tax=Riccia sorocarpa TaxID=122646 RepID=A0ABD3HKA5_9MARC
MVVFEQVVAMMIDGGIQGVRMAVLMQHLIEKGGTRRHHVNSNTTHIVANSWNHVEQRFEHTEKVLKRVVTKFKIVHYDWLTEYLKAGVTLWTQIAEIILLLCNIGGYLMQSQLHIGLGNKESWPGVQLGTKLDVYDVVTMVEKAWRIRVTVQTIKQGFQIKSGRILHTIDF